MRAAWLFEAIPSTAGWGQLRAEVGVNHGISAQSREREFRARE